MSNTNQFSKTLNALMRMNKITVQRAAKIAGVPTSTLQDWRTDSVPTDFAAVRKLAHFFGVSFSFLLTGLDDLSNANNVVSLTQVFEEGQEVFDGYLKVRIERILPKKKEVE